MTKITQDGDVGHIHRLFHRLANKHKVDVDKVSEIIWGWENAIKNEHDAIVKRLEKKFGVKND